MVQEKYANDFRCVTNMQINHFRTLKMYLPCFNAITTTLNSIQNYSSQTIYYAIKLYLVNIHCFLAYIVNNYILPGRYVLSKWIKKMIIFTKSIESQDEVLWIKSYIKLRKATPFSRISSSYLSVSEAIKILSLFWDRIFFDDQGKELDIGIMNC